MLKNFIPTRFYTLGRFDLYYSRNNKSTDKISGKDFLENYQPKLKQTNKNFSLEKNPKGWILKIGSRRSTNYFRIYDTQNSFKFELEMKGKFLGLFWKIIASQFLLSWLVSYQIMTHSQTNSSYIRVEFWLDQIRNTNKYKKFCQSYSILKLCSTFIFWNRIVRFHCLSENWI